MAATVGCMRYLLVGAPTPLRRSTSLPSSSSFSSWTWKPNPISFPIQNHAFRSPEKFFTPLAAASPFDLSPPPIDLDLLDTVTEAGAKVSEAGIIETFDNDDEALDAVDNGVVVVDLSHFGRIRVSGDDRIQFLHNQSTANFECLQEGQGCDTVFVTPTARTIDVAHAWIMVHIFCRQGRNSRHHQENILLCFSGTKKPPSYGGFKSWWSCWKAIWHPSTFYGEWDADNCRSGKCHL
ncbi:uncharacterized protein LOC117925823 isoform X2 [Vitis riparia]|uniref:uncharacterized protein LOC117925823 isoform X2 n=1 Tax=Vitis riparia TaxID=96939 RepID=UPI00155B013A|nr:uncharacterized protein LOC117925823 isoform X2 [Vitis riparia]